MFIAEIGINHKGSETRALSMLKALIATNVDAITFQIPKPEFYTASKWGEPLSNEFYKKAIALAHRHQKQMGFAVADRGMVDFFANAGADFFKTLSSSINDAALLGQLQKTNKPLFVSTGLSTEKEIINASKNLKNVTLIHTKLSPKLEEANLGAIEQLKKVTKKNVAFGLHCQDVQALYLAQAFKPSDTFFYVKDNRQEKFPDDNHAILIKDIDTTLGNAKSKPKWPTYELILRRRSIRKFIKKKIKKSDIFDFVNAARLAPNSMNAQSLEYIIVTKDIKGFMQHTNWRNYASYSGPRPGEEPAAYILAISNTKINNIASEANYDVGFAFENIFLTAMERGISCCVVGSVDREKLPKYLNIPKHYTLQLAIALGCAKQKSVPATLKEYKAYGKKNPGFELYPKRGQYWLDEKGVEHVPKRALKDIIHQESFKK